MDRGRFEHKLTEIRDALRAARFDERTSSEAGFAKIFESEIKPRLLEQVERNLEVEGEIVRRQVVARRLRVPLCVAAPLCFLPLFMPFVLSLGMRGVHADSVMSITLYSISSAVIGAAALVWLMLLDLWVKSAAEEDPNRAFVIDKVLSQFGCRLVREAWPVSYAPMRPPVMPEHTMLRLFSDRVTGTFEQHLGFSAWRATSWVFLQGHGFVKSFRGWYLKVDLPFSFSGITVVCGRFGKHQLGPEAKAAGLTDVSLESPDFARSFTVASNDHREARLILPPDVMHHLTESTLPLPPKHQTFSDSMDAVLAASMAAYDTSGDIMLGFSGSSAHAWIPSPRSELLGWTPNDVAGLIDGLHQAFAEIDALRDFLREIDVIAEYEGFRVQAARGTRAA